jgi:hypothetical protein
MQLATAAARLGFVPRELPACLCVAELDSPDDVESTADVPLEKVGLLKKAFDGLAAPFTILNTRACADVGNGDAARFLRKSDWIIHDFAQK